MSEITIPLDVSKVCVETAAKRTYDKSISRYFKATTEDQKPLESQIDILVQFLRETDFQYLRSTYEALRGGSKTVVELRQQMNGKIVLFADNTPIVPGTDQV